MTKPTKVKCHVFQVADPNKTCPVSDIDQVRGKITLSALTFDRTKHKSIFHTAAKNTIEIAPHPDDKKIADSVENFLFNVEWAIIGSEYHINTAASESVYSEWSSIIDQDVDERYNIIFDMINIVLQNHLSIVTNLQTAMREKKIISFEAWVRCRTIMNTAVMPNFMHMLRRIAKAEHLDKNHEKEWFKSKIDKDIKRIIEKYF